MSSLHLDALHWSPDASTELLRGVHLEVPAGSFVGLIGPNGSGKTSLLRCAFRYARPQRGRVVLDGDDLWRQPPRWAARRIAVVLQEFPEDFGLAVEDVVAMGRTPHKGLFDGHGADDRQRVRQALLQVGLEGRAASPFASLSGGEKQRALLARALVQEPRLLILDEPTNHLDPRYQLELLRLSMKHPILHHLLLGALLACADAALAERYPLSVRSCEREVTFERAPSRAVSHDINLTEMMVALGLQTRMVGYTGISGWWKNADPGLIAALKPLPELVARYPTAETLLDVDADFFFAGWGYGMRVGGDLTPASLEPLGVKVYELSESCAQIGEPRRASLDELYRDLRNLGRIFDVEPRAERLVASLQARIERARAGIPANAEAPRVFLYDSGEDRPFTSGRLGMPQALIEAAGGRSVTDDVAASWTQVNWESVVARDPQVIVIVDYGETSAAQKQRFLEENPALRSLTAIRERRFIVLPYNQATPGIGNAAAIETLVAGLHPRAPRP